MRASLAVVASALARTARRADPPDLAADIVGDEQLPSLAICTPTGRP